MFYTRLRVKCQHDYAEMLIAELSGIGFDTFMETDDGFEGFSEAENYDKIAFDLIFEKYSRQTQLNFSLDHIQKKNWNEEWEKSYQPIDIEGRCLIRADFHQPAKPYPYEIIITPKMSFGTGHHQTTYLMIKNQMQIDHQGKSVMDAGCGTAVLSIMACKLGARIIEAFDIDEWSVINGTENAAINGCTGIHIRRGKVAELDLSGKFDIVLANINKNVLLEEIRTYNSFLASGGMLLLSGFYTQDIPDLFEESAKYGLVEVSRDTRDNWACLLLRASG